MESTVEIIQQTQNWFLSDPKHIHFGLFFCWCEYFFFVVKFILNWGQILKNLILYEYSIYPSRNLTYIYLISWSVDIILNNSIYHPQLWEDQGSPMDLFSWSRTLLDCQVSFSYHKWEIEGSAREISRSDLQRLCLKMD